MHPAREEFAKLDKPPARGQAKVSRRPASDRRRRPTVVGSVTLSTLEETYPKAGRGKNESKKRTRGGDGQIFHLTVSSPTANQNPPTRRGKEGPPPFC